MTTVVEPINAPIGSPSEPNPQVDERRLSYFSRFNNFAEWLHWIGDVPLKRIVMTPLIGTATDADLLRFVNIDKRLVEMIDGTLVEKPMGSKESRIASDLIFYLLQFIKPRKLGSVSGEAGLFRMSNGRVRIPDVAFIAAEQLKTKQAENPIPQISFLLAIEVLSEDNTPAEMRQKLREYFDSGTRLMWIVDPKTQTVAVFDSVTEAPSKTLTSADTLDGGDVLPGFTLPLNQLFES